LLTTTTNHPRPQHPKLQRPFGRSTPDLITITTAP
jgi:hypothetical protein